MAKEKAKHDGLLCFLLALIVVLILVIGGGAYYFLVVDNEEENVIVQQGNNCTTNIYITKKDIPTCNDIEYDSLIGDVSHHLSVFMSKNKIILDNTFINSKEELNEYFEKFFEGDEEYLSLGMDSGWVSVLDIIKEFDDEYFEKHNLAINIGPYMFISANIQNGNETINLQKLYRQGTLALPEYFNFITLNKDVEKVNFDIYTYQKESITDVLEDYSPIIAIIIGTLIIIIFSRILYKSKNKVTKAFIITILFVVILAVILSFMIMYADYTTADKPIIYLYPTQETDVNVKLEKSGSITTSYPKYINGWNVKAKPNGDLIDLDTGKNLYALYYENKNNIDFKVTDEGFCIRGKDVTAFLEEKLKVLGLNERESEEFIIYWLPKLIQILILL